MLKEDILGFIATRDSVEKEALGRPEPRFPGGYTQSFTQRAMEEIHERKEPIRGERNHANLWKRKQQKRAVQCGLIHPALVISSNKVFNAQW